MRSEIKIILALSVPGTREWVHQLIESQDGLRIVAEARTPIEILTLMARNEADVVILDLPDTNLDPGICSHLLAEFPELLIVALSSNHEEAILYRQNLSKTRITDVSDSKVIALIEQIKEDESN